MTTPTQAQIEAGAKAIARGRIHPLLVSAEGEDPEGGWEHQVPLAKAALTAAEQVEKPTAYEAGRATYGDPHVNLIVKNVIAATIERCAQVADTMVAEVAAAIRKLKDAP
jgi:hypothetical protein